MRFCMMCKRSEGELHDIMCPWDRTIVTHGQTYEQNRQVPEGIALTPHEVVVVLETARSLHLLNESLENFRKVEARLNAALAAEREGEREA